MVTTYARRAAERRWNIGSEVVLALARRLFSSVPGEIAVYTHVWFPEDPAVPAADLDMLVLSPRLAVVSAVTRTETGTFGRDSDTLTGHPGAARQVRQLTAAHRRVVASTPGHYLTCAGVPIIPMLVLDGEIDTDLQSYPYFSLNHGLRLPRCLHVIRAADFVGFVLGRSAGQADHQLPFSAFIAECEALLIAGADGKWLRS